MKFNADTAATMRSAGGGSARSGGFRSGRAGLLLVDLIDRAADLLGVGGWACDQALLRGFSEPESVVYGAEQQNLTEEIKPGGEQEEEAELGAISVEPSGEPLADGKTQRKHLDED